MSPLKRKRLKVIFFGCTSLLHPFVPSWLSLRRLQIARATSVSVRSSDLNQSITIGNPAPALPLTPPHPSPSPPLANRVLALAQRTPLAAILAAYDSGLPDKCESPALRCCAVDTSCPRAGGRNGRRGGCPRRPLLPPSSVAGRRQLAGEGHASSSSKEHLPPSTHLSPPSAARGFPSTRVRRFSGRIGLASPPTR